MRYAGPKCRLCRASGVKLFLKGDKCESPKCPVVRRQAVPGQRKKRRLKISGYGEHLREKQKLKNIYLVSEAQLRKYFDQSLSRLGNTGEMMLSLLERRLDNVLVRGGLSVSHAQARQGVRHRHFRVNGRVVDIPSYVVRVGERISFDKEITPVDVNYPVWMTLDAKKSTLLITGLPSRDDVKQEVNEHLVVGYYSR